MGLRGQPVVKVADLFGPAIHGKVSSMHENIAVGKLQLVRTVVCVGHTHQAGAWARHTRGEQTSPASACACDGRLRSARVCAWGNRAPRTVPQVARRRLSRRRGSRHDRHVGADGRPRLRNVAHDAVPVWQQLGHPRRRWRDAPHTNARLGRRDTRTPRAAVVRAPGRGRRRRVGGRSCCRVTVQVGSTALTRAHQPRGGRREALWATRRGGRRQVSVHRGGRPAPTPRSTVRGPCANAISAQPVC